VAATRESPRRQDTPVHRWPGGAEGTILHAFASNPTLGWTAAGLADWYGMRVDQVRVVLRDLVARGSIRRTGSLAEEFKLTELAHLESRTTASSERSSGH
jgi:hypothetical protein